VKNKEGKKKEYTLTTFQRTNDFSAFYHRAAVTVGDKVKRGDLLADTSSTDNGQIAVGQNAMVAFMSHGTVPTTKTPSSSLNDS
jgi:DNA-directed RNA polymerase subunit beta